MNNIVVIYDNDAEGVYSYNRTSKLRTSATLTAAIGNCSRAHGVVPFRMERVTLNVERLHLGIADLDALLVSARVQRALDFQAGLGCRRCDQLDDSQAIRERPAAPGLRDVAEQAVLDPVPLRCARRIMVDVEHEPGLVGEPLQLDLPQPDACAIRAAAVGCDRQLTRIRIALAPHAVQPLPDRGDSELCRIARDGIVTAIRACGVLGGRVAPRG